jgi:hypothetical protein
MKKSLSLIILFCVTTLFVNAQVCDYFNKSGFKTLAKCAHPTDKFLKGKCSQNGSMVTVDIDYTDEDHAQFKLYNQGYLFYSLSKMVDDSRVEPFAVLTLVKNVFSEVCKNLPSVTKNKVLKEVETVLGKTIGKFNGKDYTILALTIGYYRYQKKV